MRGGLAPPAGAARCLPPAQARVLEGLGPARLPSGLQETESPAQARAQRGASSSSTAGVPWKHSHLVGTGAQSGTGALRAGGHFGSAAQDGCVGARTAAPPQSTAGPRSGACVQSAGRTGSLPPGNPGGLSGINDPGRPHRERRGPPSRLPPGPSVAAADAPGGCGHPAGRARRGCCGGRGVGRSLPRSLARSAARSRAGAETAFPRAARVRRPGWRSGPAARWHYFGAWDLGRLRPFIRSQECQARG